MPRVQGELLEGQTNEKLLCRKGFHCCCPSLAPTITPLQVLESMRRTCRYELFGCDFAFNESAVLVAHEKVCHLKPEGASDELEPVEDSSDDGEHVDEAGVEQDEQQEAVNNPMFLNLVFFYDTRPFLHFYAVAVVFLRTFIFHFSDVKRPSGR